MSLCLRDKMLIHFFFHFVIVRRTMSIFFVVGLDDEEKITRRVCCISLERPDSVSTIDSTPACVGEGAAACVMGNTLYTVGIGRAGTKLWKWNATSDWTRCSDMTSGRRWHCAAVVDLMLYALGGWVDFYDVKTLSNRVEAYNTQTNKWSAAGQLKHAVCLAACVSYNNLNYVFGGVDLKGKAVSHVQVYDASQHKCTLLHNAMPRTEYRMRAVRWETYAILLGRETCFIYNFETETWQERASFKTNVNEFGLVVDNQTLYIAGGNNTLTAEVLRVSVRDVIEDKQGARWTHHATLPHPARVHVFSPVPLYRLSTKARPAQSEQLRVIIMI